MSEAPADKTAMLIATLHGWRGHVRLYRCDPPMPEHPDWENQEGPPKTHRHVIVSANTVIHSGPETYIFPADGDTWEVLDFSDMPGSQRGTLSHEEVLSDLGYRIV